MAGCIRTIAILVASALIAAALPLAAEEGAAAARALSLRDAIEQAFQNDADVVAQEQEVVAARAVKLGATGEFLPKVDLIGSYMHKDAVLSFPPSFTATLTKDEGVYTGYNDELRAGFAVEQPIYRGGRNMAGYKQANLKLSSQEERLRAKKLTVELETKRLYYGLLLAYETERITKQLVDQTEIHYRDVEKKYRQGTSSRFDVLQSKVQVSKVMPQMLAAQKARQVIAAELKRELGMELTDELALAGRLSYTPIKVDEQAFQEEALAHNPEIALRRLGVDIGQQGVSLAKAGWKPQIGANLRYEYISDDPTDMFNDRHLSWSGGVNIAIPLFDGLSALSKTREAKARFEIARTEKEDVARRVAIDVKRACLDLAEAASVVASQRASVGEAKEALKIAEVSYGSGVGTNLDVLDAQVSLAAVEKNLSEAMYDYLMAKAALDRTRGASDVMEESDGEAH
jgi:outer membrane protein